MSSRPTRAHAYSELLPTPLHAEPSGGELVLDRRSPLRLRVTGADPSILFAGLAWLGMATTLVDGAAMIEVESGVKSLTPEEYRLEITPDRVSIHAGSVAGARHAMTTLRQLAPSEAWRQVPVADVWRLPCGVVADRPGLAWRGGLVDPARNFLPKQALLRYVDLLAAHKLNVFHLHLTDDQGWRVESARYPAVTATATHRPATAIGHRLGDAGLDGTPHGGYYRLDDLREIAEYGRRQGVTVLPEIDLPGHTSALLAALPDLGVGGEVRQRWGISNVMVRPTPEAMSVVLALLDEVIDACRPSMLHLGGDECRASAWEADPVAADHLRRRGLTVRQGYAEFVNTVAAHLTSRGVRPVVWEEAFLAGGLTEQAVVMSWRGETAAQLASARGHEVVLAPVMPCYFDFYQERSQLEPLGIQGPVTLDDVSAFDPKHRDWAYGDEGKVIGTQFCAWGQYISDERQLDYMAFPRASVLADAAWRGTASGLTADDGRLVAHLARLDAMGVEYRPFKGPHAWQQGGTGVRKFFAGDPIEMVLERIQDVASSGLIEPGERPRDEV